MAEPYIGEIRIFSFVKAPKGWAHCNGQLLDPSVHESLFNLIGTTYGGDGRTTFAVPDFRGRVPVHFGTGHGLSPVKLGEKGGEETVTLTIANLPKHRHFIAATKIQSNTPSPGNAIIASAVNLNTGNDFPLYTNGTASQVMHPSSVGNTGGGKAHNNIQPGQVLHFCIALEGLFPNA